MIPQAFIQDLLARTDIVDLVGRYLPLKKGGANYFACCPFHGEKTASFSVSPTKQFYHCFGCGAHGSAIGFLMEYSGLSYVDAIKELATQAGLPVPEESSGQRGKGPSLAPLSEALDRAGAFYRDQLRSSTRAVAYLKGRGLSGEIARRYGIGYAPEGWQALAAAFPDYQDPRLTEAGLVIENDQGRRYDRFRDRIMFPIQNQRGAVIGFGGRILDSGEPKYINSPETPLFEKGRELYGQVQAREAIRARGTVIVVEGYMDVVSLAQFGVGNAVATLGTATTPAHVQRLLRLAEKVVFCFDGDAAGRRAAWRALESSLEHLADDRNVAFLFLPPEHDPDSFVRAEGAESFERAAQAATPLAQFLESELAAELDLDSPEGRARYAHEARPLVTRIGAPLLRLQILKSVAEKAGMTQAELEQSYGLRRSRAENPPPGGAPRQAVRQQIQPRRGPLTPVETLLRIALLHPRLVARIRSDGVPAETPAGRTLLALIDADGLGELPSRGGVGALIEHFRDTEHEGVIRQVAASTDDGLFDDAVLETLFADTLSTLHVQSLRAEFEQLQEKLRAGGRLSPEELQRYSDLPRELRHREHAHREQDS